MQCKSCEYPLWNLKARQCPECGTAFKPSEFDFVINSVRFCCPHCNQAYYGTSEKGHLVPDTFDCVTCGAHITMDEMVLLPAEGVQDHQTKIDHAPWLQRKRMGFVKAWFSTVFQGMFMPGKLMRGISPESGQAQAWGYATLTLALLPLINIALVSLIVFLLTAIFGGSSGFGGLLDFGFAMIMLLASLWVGLLVLMVIWGLITHGVLLVMGGAKWPMSRTFQAILYAAGGAGLIAVPMLGIYPFLFVPLVWWMVSAMIMVSTAQSSGAGKAIVATGAFPLLMTVITFGGLFALVFVGMNVARTSVQRAQAASAANVVSVLQQQLMPAAVESGAYPPFGIVNVSEDGAELSGFMTMFSMTDIDQVMIGDLSLMEIMLMEDAELRQAYIDQVAAAMPDDVIAHRIGDCVFTYHGMTVNEMDGELWVLVLVPPGLGNNPQLPAFMEQQISAITADGGTVTFKTEEFTAALEAQNLLRATRGLPEMPDPRTITYDAPIARASGDREAYQGTAP